MNKKMREILAKIEKKTAEAKSYLDGENKDVAKATTIMDEVDALKAEYAVEERLFKAEKEENTPTVKEMEDKKNKEKELDSISKFARDARNGFKSMNEGTPGDGGYTVPEDIQTKINTYRESKFSLLNLVRVEKVTTNSGARTFKKRTQQTGFTKVGEGGKIGAKATPQFERIVYEIAKYAGYFPITNELLADSDANLAQVLIEWIGDESRVTANKLILEQIATKEATAFSGLDDIKKALNVDLGSAFKSTSTIITNDSGLQYLDTLKDADDNYLLTTSPSDPMKLVLCAGATTIPVAVIPNSDLPNDTTTNSGYARIPFIVGDLNEGIVYWDRESTTIKLSDTAQVGDLNAFEEDLTLYRAIEREDVTTRDTKAFINGYIEIPEA